mmetsp:Transcript_16700/g.23210  ORF Transcript_16700/g.23210 Transcript_16700/m.23210 type:complete len:88 (+) Transcript_16700:880-1143(+)
MTFMSVLNLLNILICVTMSYKQQDMCASTQSGHQCLPSAAGHTCRDTAGPPNGMCVMLCCAFPTPSLFTMRVNQGHATHLTPGCCAL